MWYKIFQFMNDLKKDPAAEELWNRAKIIYLSSLKDDKDRLLSESYFSMIVSVSNKDGVFHFTTSNNYSSEFLKNNFSEKIKQSLLLAGCNPLEDVVFTVDSNISNHINNPKPVTSPSQKPTEHKKDNSSFMSTTPLEENYTFEEFVQGPSNSWAFASAKGVANNPGQKSNNPLFIHGGTGLGKTHLMQAIGNELKKTNPSLSVCYLTTETFLNEYVNSVQQKGMDSFREKYRAVDVLLLDDIQFLQRGKLFQEEFFNTFNDLISKHKQIVMTSDVAPQNLPALEKRLISRFEGGLVQEIEAPAYETRLAILKKKSENLVPSIPMKTLEFLADNIKSHVRAMEGALSKVYVSLCSNPAQEMSKDFLSFLLRDLIQKEQTLKKLTIKEIQECVAKKYGITLTMMLSGERTQSLVTPRQLAMYISRKYTPKSLQEIAAEFDKTHATVLHGVKTIQKRMDVEEELKNSLEEILGEFGYKLSDKME